MNSAEIPVLLSVVVVVRNEAQRLYDLVKSIEEITSRLVSDYEIVIVDNGSTDQTSRILRNLTSQNGEANLQVYALAGRVDDLTARWIGVENSLGDIVACIDPNFADIAQLEVLTREASNGFDIVFTKRFFPRDLKSLPGTLLYKSFGSVIKFSTGLDFNSYSTSVISISRRVVNYLLQFSEPHIKFRALPTTTGFSRTFVNIPIQQGTTRDINFGASLSKGIHLITSSSDSPMRLATSLSAFGALASLVYSVYVVLIWAFKEDVAPGWVSLAFQLSAMFFLISLVLLVLSEYVLNISRKSNSGPKYYIADELTSARLTRKERLNVEVDDIVSSRAIDKHSKI